MRTLITLLWLGVLWIIVGIANIVLIMLGWVSAVTRRPR